MIRSLSLATLSTLLTALVHAGNNPVPVPDSPAEGPLDFSLEARVRGEWRENNFDFDSQKRAVTDDAWLLSRLRLGVEWKATPWLRFYVEGQDSREFFSDRSNVIGQLGAEGDNAFDLRQGLVQIGDPHALSVTLGRQELDYGDGRLVSRAPWKNTGQSFDAVKVHYETKTWWLDAFTSSVVRFRGGEFDQSDWLNESDASHEFFSGLYFSTTALDVQVTDLYAFEVHSDDKGGSDFVTLGTRMKADPKKLSGWDYETEMAVQFGDRYDKDLRAFAGHWGGGYVWLDSAWKPRLGVEYSYASGDSNAADGRLETFQNLFPTNHPFYGLMDLFSWQNLQNPAVKFSMEPAAGVKVMLDYHLFWLTTTNDAWYRANQLSTVRPVSPGASSYAGSELDLTVQWKAAKHLDVQAGYSHFFAGDYLADTGASSDADFAYLMLSFKL